MLQNYLKIILRQFARYKTFSTINVLGLSAGLICTLLIGLYIADEYSYDRHHSKLDRLYVVVTEATFNGQTNRWTGVPNLGAPTIAREVPEVEKAVRLFWHNFGNIAFVSNDEVKSSENWLAWGDPELFDVLDYHFIHGDPNTALTRPGTAVISENAAMKYFGTTEALGKTLTIDNTTEVEITGVYENPPANSRFAHPVIATFKSNYFGAPANESWGNASFQTIVLLNPGVDKKVAEQKIADAINKNIPAEDRWFKLTLKPLSEMYLYSHDIAEFGAGAIRKGDVKQLEILGALGFIVILIAAVNYMNLSTAQSQRRFKEIGIGKALGATRQQLARQFYTETATIVLVALLISIIVCVVSLPAFNALTGKAISLYFLSRPLFWVSFLFAWALLSLSAGLYPALYLSGFSPKEVLKGGPSGVGGNITLRKALVVVQFTASIVLIISTVILNQQLGFIRNKNLGYQPEQVVAIMTQAAQNPDQVQSLKASLQQLPGVVAVGRAQAFPGEGASGRSLAAPDGQGEGKYLSTVRATSEILDVLGVRLLAGTTLPENKSKDDATIQVVLNKAAVDFLGYSPEEAINRKVKVNGFQDLVEVVGVCEDFHFASLHQEIGAYCFHNAPTERYTYMLVKMQTDDLPQMMGRLEQEYKKIIPSAFEFTFLDQKLAAMYESETRLAGVILLFASLAIFIACLGLYALAAYTTERRVKEIGIRKALGASIGQLANMLSADFVKLVIVSFVIAAPIGYYLMDQWLQGFAYRVSVNLLVVALAGVLSVAIAWLTVGIESWRAARVNPVQSLRSE